MSFDENLINNPFEEFKKLKVYNNEEHPHEAQNPQEIK